MLFKELALGPLSYGEWAAAAPGMIVGVVPEGIPESEHLQYEARR